MMMNKLTPILAKAVVTLVFATISGLGVKAQAFDSQVYLNDLDTPAIVQDLNAENIKYLKISDDVDGILDTKLIELSDYHIDSQVTEVDEVPGNAELDRLPNTPLDAEDIQVLEVFDLADKTNR